MTNSMPSVEFDLQFLHLLTIFSHLNFVTFSHFRVLVCKLRQICFLFPSPLLNKTRILLCNLNGFPLPFPFLNNVNPQRSCHASILYLCCCTTSTVARSFTKSKHEYNRSHISLNDWQSSSCIFCRLQNNIRTFEAIIII